MQHIIHALLSLSEIGRNNLTLKAVNTQDLVADILSEMPNADTGKVPTIDLGDLPVVQADVALLRQVFVNLLTNALKYSATKPHPTVKISANTEVTFTHFFVEDNGLGFDEKATHRLFQVFGRLHPDVEGIGIGLVIVKKIVEKHGGQVTASGALGKGARFGFSLPKG
jgi:two-component system, sensor histidine kinase and response regulator